MMGLLRRYANFLDRHEPFLFTAMSVIFVISLIGGDVEGMVASGTISTWFRLERMEKRIKNERVNSV